MIRKNKERELALRLRKDGLSYREILASVPVAKSSLSLWLRKVSLAKEQKQRLTQKKLLSAMKGAAKRRQQRLDITKEIKKKAKNEINWAINQQELWLMGTMLYWAEGSKEKEYDSGVSVIFSNSDPLMIKLFLKWIQLCLKVPSDKVYFVMYIHDNHKNKTNRFIKYWSGVTGFSVSKFDKIYYKKHKPKTVRKNTGNNYYGLLRVQIRESVNLNRKIAGWIEGICINCGVV